MKAGELSAVETTKAVIKEIKKLNDYNYFNTISESLALELAERADKNPKGRLAGLPVSLKDDLCIKGVETTCSSNILKGYKPTFNASVVEKLINEGAVIIGKTNQDTFGFGSFNVNTDYKIPKNPLDTTRVTWGSSGGAAGFTALTKFPHVAIGESTGGSIAAPCSFCGVTGMTPTYGLVSRYGLIDYANSLDKIGPIAKNVEDLELVLDVIKGKYKKTFKKYDLLVSPTMPIIAPKFSEVNKLKPKDHYMMDIMTVGPNLAGIPHISLNAGTYNKMPVGIMFMGDYLNEKKLFNIGNGLQDN